MASSEAISDFCTAWAIPHRRLWLSSLIGDWPAADEAAAGQPDLTVLTAPRANVCRELRGERLKRELAAQNQGADALWALADLGAVDLKQCLEEALRKPPSGQTLAALSIIEHQNNPRWYDPVFALFSYLDPTSQHPHPHLWMKSLKYLLEHGHRTGELIAALPKVDGSEIGEAVLVALEYAPELALPLVRRGLIDDIPRNRTMVAAILALVAKPWSRQELMAALHASDDQHRTADVRAALLELGDDEAQNAVLAWEEQNPHEKGDGSYLDLEGKRFGPFYTLDELSLKDRAERIRYEMDALHDRVMKVKHVIPPEPPTTRVLR
ncbi:hypothetical protein ACYOEI_08260 [Singulisphaera rosea]